MDARIAPVMLHRHEISTIAPGSRLASQLPGSQSVQMSFPHARMSQSGWFLCVQDVSQPQHDFLAMLAPPARKPRRDKGNCPKADGNKHPPNPADQSSPQGALNAAEEGQQAEAPKDDRIEDSCDPRHPPPSGNPTPCVLGGDRAIENRLEGITTPEPLPQNHATMLNGAHDRLGADGGGLQPKGSIYGGLQPCGDFARLLGHPDVHVVYPREHDSRVRLK